VYQEVNLCDNLSVGENVMLGHEVHGPFGINWRKTHEAAHDALNRLGLGALDPRQPLSSISLALQQLVAISRAMVTNSKVLILDEPTSSLDANEVEGLFTVIRRLRDEGVAILFVSHFLDQVYAISDRLTVLRNGEFVGEHMTPDLTRGQLISQMIGKDVASLNALGSNRGRAESSIGRPYYSATGLGRKGSIEPVDIEVHAGEVVGLAGLLGSGRTELGRLIYGADRPDTGTVTIGGTATEVHSPVNALAQKIAFSTENRRDEGIIGDLTVRENLILAVQARRGWARPLSKREQTEICAKYLVELNVRPADPERMIRNLSGGNQQKVLLGRWLATKPELLILDEPTRGIDVGAKAEIQETIAALAEDGMSVVFISSELEEVVRLSERIIVLKDHRKIGEIVNGPSVTADTIVDIIASEGSSE
jgi:monosaccharide-transporting ATPase